MRRELLKMHLLQEQQEAVRQRLVLQVQWQRRDWLICREQIVKDVQMPWHLL